MRLSKNFTLSELLRSQIATRVGGSVLEDQKNPSEQIIDALQYHCQSTVQKARDFLLCSIIIGSGYRGPKVNKLCRGSKTSQHCLGEATDQDLSDSFFDSDSDQVQQINSLVHAVTGKPIRNGVNPNFYLFAYYVLFIHYTDIDQVIHEYGEDGEPEWVHASSSMSKINRREILIVRRKNVNGKMKSVYTKLNTKQALMLGC